MSRIPVELAAPDIESHRRSSTGVDFVHTFESGRPGPHAMVNAITHGNEICGAIAVDRLLRMGVRPTRGTLTLSFANVDAFLRFDPKRPYATRFLDEDFNRVWNIPTLDGTRDSTELRRARALRPFVEAADYLLDIHSMLEPSPAVMICGPLDKGIRFAFDIAIPRDIVSDEGHANGTRMRDFGGFGDPGSPRNALLVECGQHWERAAPEISDVEFDALTRRLQQLRPYSPALAHLGPRPGAGGAVRHGTPMLSLDKCYEEAELARWLADIGGDVLVMPKVDGLACTIRYDASGAMEVAATRGDGEVGEDITANVRAVLGVPTRLARGPLEVRGEVYLSLQAFERHKAQGKANPRNMAAGALRQKDPNQTRAAGLSFLAYDVRGAEVPTQGEKLALARELGFDVVEHEVVPVASAPATVQRFAERRAALPYETDGVVLVADRVAEHARLGVTAHHPRWAIAWKFQGEEGTSVLRGVEWSVARTGTITPVALVDPVALSGVTVTRATLHHKGFIEKLGLTLGATVAMVRRGGVIPHVERVLSAGSAPVEMPSACPGCGAPVLVEGEFLMCSAPAGCHRARVGQLLHFVSAVDIQGLGEAIVDEAVQKGVLSSPADLYRVGAAALAALDKCGEKNGEKIATEIDKKRVLELEVLLRALGIEGLGKTAARTLAERYPSLARLREATAGELAAIKGFGEITAGQIVDGLRAHAALLEELLTFVQVRQAAATGDSGGSAPLAGMSFVFTGALSMDRKHAEARVTRLGAKVASSVTRALTHLVTGGSERDAPSTKQKAAEKLIAEGAPIAVLSEQAFEELLASLETVAAPTPPPPEATQPSEALAASAKKQQLTLF